MGFFVFLLLILFTAAAALAKPWIGVVGGYVVALLTPQAIWWWHFGSLRPALYIAVPTLIGVVLALLRGDIGIRAIQNARVAWLLILWLFIALSFWFGPYVSAGGPYRFTDPAWMFSVFNKILLLCLIGCLCITDMKRLQILCGAFVISAVYLSYWANMKYIDGQVIGRLAGPVDLNGVGTYSDENSFGMLFVVTGPFLWFLGYLFRPGLLRWGTWLIIPFLWHAVFLTASRAGLIALGTTLAVIGWRSKNKAMGLLLIPAFIVTYSWQAGDLMKERAATITDRTEVSSATRLEAWTAAAEMVADNPLIGVGLASFGPAFPHYSEKKPREAHNTALQIFAESGVVAGAMYLLIIAGSIVGLARNGSRLRKLDFSVREIKVLYHINEAILASFMGLIVCSIFASLQMYEVFYFLFVLVNATLFVSAKVIADTRSGEPEYSQEPRSSVLARRLRG